MQYFLNNLNNKLKKAVIKDKVYHSVNIKDKPLEVTNALNKLSIEKFPLFITQDILLKFLFLFSENLLSGINKKTNLLVFIKLYNYLNSFFLNDKSHFFKKFFLKNIKQNVHYLNNFFFNKKYFDYKQSLVRLKEKRISFYKKNIWTKKKKFRKKNILIFNLLFFKRYHTKRFNSFITDSLLVPFKSRKHKYFRSIKKSLDGIFYRRYRYIFSQKRYVFNTRKKRYRKYFLLKLRYKKRSIISYKKKFYVKHKWIDWRKVYSTRSWKNCDSRILFCSLNSNAFNFFAKNIWKRNPLKNLIILKDYYFTYAYKLAKKYHKDKNFLKRFFSRRTFIRRVKNLMYYYKWKPKYFNFCSFNYFKNNKKVKNTLFSLIWQKLFFRKIFWKNKKLQKSFIVFFFKYFFYNKCTFFFNSFIKNNIFFSNRRRAKRLFKLRKRRFTIYNKKRRRRFLKKKHKIRILHFFVILLFFKFMKKNKNAEKIFIFKNAFIYNNLKKINTHILYSIFFGNKQFYFYNNKSFTDANIYLMKNKDSKIISLLKSK
jgi:hypothetical protein